MLSIKEIRNEEITEALKLIHRIFPNCGVRINYEDFFIIAEKKGCVVGFIHFNEKNNSIILRGFGVEEKNRRSGVGMRLLSNAIKMLNRKDKPIYLKVKMFNTAINLYKNHGFFLEKFGHVCILAKLPNN